MKTAPSVATLSTAALFWLSCCRLSTSTSTKQHLRSRTSSSTPSESSRIRPLHRNLDKVLDDADPRIVNGWDAVPDKYPYYVRWGGCGGSLIHPKWVLTAGHCGGQSTSLLRVGAYSQNGNDGNDRFIDDRIYHPQYEDLKYDFLLLELNDPVYTEYATLNDDGGIPGESGELEVIGLGRLNYRPGDKPDVLQEVIVPNHDMDYCRGAYGGFNPVTMLCAGNTTYDSCVGDSGGPIFSYDRSGQRVQVGLTSFGDDCAKEGKPGVYARISYAYEWIESVVCDDGNSDGMCGGGSSSGTPEPTPFPTQAPTPFPTVSPTPFPTEQPTPSPTRSPTPFPTVSPTPFPTVSPTPFPTVSPTPAPTPQPSVNPTTPEPTPSPTKQPTPSPTKQPTQSPPPMSSSTFRCDDDSNDFPIASAPTISSCAYLAGNLNSYGYMCDFVDVAVTCRETCGLCTLLRMFYEQG